MVQLVYECSCRISQGRTYGPFNSLIHAYTAFLCISSQFPRFLLIVVITSLFACETFGLTIVLHLGRLREMCTFKSIIRWMLATEGTIFPILDI